MPMPGPHATGPDAEPFVSPEHRGTYLGLLGELVPCCACLDFLSGPFLSSLFFSAFPRALATERVDQLKAAGVTSLALSPLCLCGPGPGGRRTPLGLMAPDPALATGGDPFAVRTGACGGGTTA